MIIDRRLESLRHVPSASPGSAYEGDENLIRRIIDAFIHSTGFVQDLGDSEWKDVSKLQTDVQRAFTDNDFERAAAILRNPAKTNLFYGFDHSFTEVVPDPSYYSSSSLDALCRFAESVGAIRLDNPESYGGREPIFYEVEEVMNAIEATIGWRFSVPNPFPAENGTLSSRGVISQRTPHALYQAWRIKQIVGHIARPRVLEIGGGLGRTAYYARELGVTDYTIVDLPMSGIGQAYFLGRAVGEDFLSLAGEEARASNATIKLRPPKWFLDTAENFDLVVNIDSMTEMDRAVADAYWNKIKLSAAHFWSVNHEVNKFRVADVIADRSPLHVVDRHCCWMRRGYAEESIVLRRQWR